MTRTARVVSLVSALTCFAAGQASVTSAVSSSDRALSSRAVGAAPAGAGHGRVAEHFACNEGPRRPCYFSNPIDDVRCVWIPTPNTVTCELLATRSGYRLRPTGRARTVKVNLTDRGETLPTNQMVVFPEKLSCQDTKTTMTCGQDEGFGEFNKLGLHAPHSA